MNIKIQQEILSGLPVGLVMLDHQGIVQWMNDRAGTLLGDWPPDSSWLDIIKACFTPRDDDGHEVSLHNGARVHIQLQALTELPGALVVLTDMTTTRQYEAQRAEQQRLLSIGRMSAQLTHQIRTPLATAMLHLDALDIMLNGQEVECQKLGKLRRNLDYMADQIQKLLSYVRGYAGECQQIKLTDWLSQWMGQVDQWLSKHQVHFQVESPEAKSTLLIDAIGLSGVMTNLIENACQAGASHIHCLVEIANKHDLILVVDDDGAGMPQHIVAQACQPFYTTKAQGTGLGLSVVEGIVQAHGGTMNIESVEGEGCRVRIMLYSVVNQ